MTDFLAAQLDYLMLVCGLSFWATAAIANGLSRADRSQLPWRVWSWFGMVCGLAYGVDLLVLSSGRTQLLAVAYALAQVSAGVLLVEFARRALRRVAGHSLGAWIQIPLLATAAVGLVDGWAGLAAAAGYAFYLVGGGWAAMVFWQMGRRQFMPAGVAYHLALCQAGYALFAGLVVAPAALFPAAVLNTDTFRAVYHVPALLLQCAAAGLLCLGLWRLYALQRARVRPPMAHGARRAAQLLASVGLVLALGWLATWWVGRGKADAMLHAVLQRAQIAAAAVEAADAAQLSWSPADLDTPAYQRVKQKMMVLRTANEDVRFVSLMGVRAGESYVLVDSEPPDSEDYSPPGQWYEEADPEYNRLLASRRDFVMGPLYDRWGAWITAAVPITDLGPEKGAIALALDTDASHWAGTIARARLPVLCIIALLVLLMGVVFNTLRRIEEAGQAQAASLERVRRQKLAVVRLSSSPVLAGGDFAAATREITETAAQALQVARVSLWWLEEDACQLYCLDLYEQARGAHSAGQRLAAARFPRYFRALDSSRTVDAACAATDERTSEFAAEYLASLGISSMLDASVRVTGMLQGVLCCEHVGPERVWLEDEVRFAAELADQVVQAWLAAERKKVEAEKRTLEAQVQQAQKMESLGVLTGGIAHDFNNLLMAILGNADLAMLDLPPGSSSREFLEQVLASSRHAAELCKQMLVYSGRSQVSMQPLSIPTLIREMSSILNVAIPKKAALRLDLAANLSAVEGDAAQLRQVIMNLVINAVEAIGDKPGEVVIRTREGPVAAAVLDRCLLGRDALPGLFVNMEVEDTGGGIAPDILARIFDPFFSTKFAGRGLGLAVVMGIVRTHRGAIEVVNQPGRGVCFRVLLPASDRAPAAAPAAADTPWHGSGLVLLAEDEEAVCRVAARMLERCGLTVVTARDGQAALDLFQARAREFDGAVLDLTMPRMAGGEAARAMRQIRADLPIAISSGFSDQYVAQHLQEMSDFVFVQKPYTFAALNAAMRALLAQRKTSPPG